MWNDIETTNDLLNFGIVADTAAQLIRDSGNEPLSIGISGRNRLIYTLNATKYHKCNILIFLLLK